MLLDDFNRIDAADLGPNWTADTTNSGHLSPRIVSNAAATIADANIRSAWWNGSTFGPDLEVAATIVDWETVGNLKGIRLQARFVEPDTANVDGYEAMAYVSTGGIDRTAFARYNNGTPTFLSDTESPDDHQVGDIIKFTLSGADLSISRFRGSWTVINSTTDGSPLLTAGYVGIYLDDNGFALDDFEVPSEVPPPPITDTLAIPHRGGRGSIW